MDKVTYCLERVVRYGTGRAAQIVVDQAGKTGTTTNNKDAWFAGYTPRLTAVAWMGHVIPREMDSVHGLTVQGGNFPAQIWRRFMAPAIAIDGRRGPALPPQFRIPERRKAAPARRESPLPEEWSRGSDAIREIIDLVEQFAGEI